MATQTTIVMKRGSISPNDIILRESPVFTYIILREGHAVPTTIIMGLDNIRYTMGVSPGTVVIGGQNVLLKATRSMLASAGAISISGQNVGLSIGRKLGIGTGAIVLGGQNVSVAYGRVLGVATGTIALAGKNVSLAFGRKLSIGTGAVVIAGQPVDLITTAPPALATYTMTVLPGTVRLGGQNVTLTRYYKNYESRWYHS